MTDDIDKSSTAVADTSESERQPSSADSDVTLDGSQDKQDEPARHPASVSIRTLLFGALVAVLVTAVGVLTWLYIEAQHKLQAQAEQDANYEQAERAALNYAVNAAEMDFKDLGAWKTKLVDRTSPELNEKLSKAADSMEQILLPLQWTSTAKPLVAKVRSESGGVYVVDAFVSVLTKTTQAPDGLQSTATYSITMDGHSDWQITDVGGIDAVVPAG